MKEKIFEKQNKRAKIPHYTSMKNKNELFLLVLLGAAVGAVNGFFGGGGGMIVVPLLISACAFSRKEAHASALIVILPISLVSAIVYAVNGEFDFSLVLPVTIGVTGGGVIGAFLLNKLNERWVKYVFSFLISAAGVKLLFF